MNDDDDFKRLLGYCAEIANNYPEGVIFIDGIAVYLHAINDPSVAAYAEATHDADFYISLADMGDLRDAEEVTPNRRLNKSQFIKGGFEFDIYTERQSGLIVPYAEAAASAVDYDGIRAASLEVLFVLKLEAFRDRQASAKGEKDAKDLLRLALLTEHAPSGFDANFVAARMSEDHLALLDRVERGPAPASMALGNAVTAKRIRQSFARIAAAIREAGSSQEAMPDGASSAQQGRPRPRRGG